MHYGQKAPGRYIENSGQRYRIRKHITFAGYRLAMVLISIVFCDKLPGLTVFFGVAGPMPNIAPCLLICIFYRLRFASFGMSENALKSRLTLPCNPAFKSVRFASC